eukprot:9052736-Pyramimonas_sp.AAC.1
MAPKRFWPGFYPAVPAGRTESQRGRFFRLQSLLRKERVKNKFLSQRLKRYQKKMEVLVDV